MSKSAYRHVESKVKQQIQQNKQHEKERKMIAQIAKNDKLHEDEKKNDDFLTDEYNKLLMQYNGNQAEIMRLKHEISKLKEDNSEQSKQIQHLESELIINKSAWLKSLDVNLINNDDFLSDFSSVCTADFTVQSVLNHNDDSVFLTQPIYTETTKLKTPKRKSLITKIRKTSKRVFKKFSCSEHDVIDMSMKPLYKPMPSPILHRTFTNGIRNSNISTPGRYNLERKIFESGKKRVLFSNLNRSSDVQRNFRLDVTRNQDQRSAHINKLVSNLNEVSEFIKTQI